MGYWPKVEIQRGHLAIGLAVGEAPAYHVEDVPGGPIGRPAPQIADRVQLQHLLERCRSRRCQGAQHTDVGAGETCEIRRSSIDQKSARYLAERECLGRSDACATSQRSGNGKERGSCEIKHGLEPDPAQGLACGIGDPQKDGDRGSQRGERLEIRVNLLQTVLIGHDVLPGSEFASRDTSEIK